jgi:hypothetical protein
MRKSRLWMLLAVGALLVYHFDVITGTLKFNRMCKAEGGPRFYGPVEKNVGWEVEGHDTYEYQRPFPFGHIAFVRYQDKQGIRSDVRMEGYKQTLPNFREPNYVFSPVNEALRVRYKFQHIYAPDPSDERFSKSVDQVIDLASGNVVATYTQFGFQWTKPERVILAASTSNGCWDGSDPGQDVGLFFKNIYEFRNKK